MPISEIREWVALTKDILVGITALVTIFIGIYGLWVWKRELVGKELYAAAKDLVKKSHLIYSGSIELRKPIHPYEIEPFTEVVRKNTTEWERWRISETNGYRKRIEKFEMVFDRYNKSRLNLRVLVGSKIYLNFLPFDRLIGEAIVRVGHYLDALNDLNKEPITPNSPDVISAQVRLYPSKLLTDELSQKTGDAREEAEKYILSFLNRKNIRG